MTVYSKNTSYLIYEVHIGGACVRLGKATQYTHIIIITQKTLHAAVSSCLSREKLLITADPGSVFSTVISNDERGCF